MHIELDDVRELRFADGSPVRAASALVPFGEGYLVVQDDATHAAWCRGESVTAVRLLPPVEGLDDFDEESGTKHLKPDLEAACRVTVDGSPAALMLGSGSSPARTRASLVHLREDGPHVTVSELAPLYRTVAEVLGVDLETLNLEGACVVRDSLRWFHRGLPSAGAPSGSVDLDLAALLALVLGREVGSVAVTEPRHYDLGEVSGVGLAVTDSVALPDGTILASAAAEDSPDVRDDGPVVGSAMVRFEDAAVADVVTLPRLAGRVSKVEGLMVLGSGDRRADLLAVVDGDDAEAASAALRLGVSW